MWSSYRFSSVLSPIPVEGSDYSIIEDKVYVGNRNFANNYQMLKSIGISLVIAVYPEDIKYCYLRPPDCRFFNIEVKDAIHEDLISHFDYCFDLMTEELVENEGKVLVFCGAGVSRSVTIICAFLMKKYKITAEEAIGRVKEKREKINPNIGFVAQLNIYEDMNYKLDPNHREYRLFILINLKIKIWTESYWKDSKVGDVRRQFCEPMESYFNKLNVNSNDPTIERSQTLYKCKECELILFGDMNVVINIDFDKNDLKNECKNIFIEPKKWMLPSICHQKSAKLKCPNCKAVLGSFKWKTFVCECLFHNQLQDSRIFKVKKSAVVKN